MCVINPLRTVSEFSADDFSRFGAPNKYVALWEFRRDHRFGSGGLAAWFAPQASAPQACPGPGISGTNAPACMELSPEALLLHLPKSGAKPPPQPLPGSRR